MKLTLYKRHVQPFDVITVGVKDEDLVGNNRDGQQEDSSERHGQRKGAKPSADPINGHLVLVRAVVVFASPPFESVEQGEARQVEQQEEQQKYLEGEFSNLEYYRRVFFDIIRI